MFELIINILLFIFLGFTFFTHVLEAAVPASVARNPYALQPDVWPKTIIILLEICLIINIIQIIRKNKGNPEFTLGAFAKSIPGFLKSKLFFGIVIMVTTKLIKTVLRCPILFIKIPVGTAHTKNQKKTMDGNKLAVLSVNSKSAFT